MQWQENDLIHSKREGFSCQRLLFTSRVGLQAADTCRELCIMYIPYYHVLPESFWLPVLKSQDCGDETTVGQLKMLWVPLKCGLQIQIITEQEKATLQGQKAFSTWRRLVCRGTKCSSARVWPKYVSHWNIHTTFVTDKSQIVTYRLFM